MKSSRLTPAVALSGVCVLALASTTAATGSSATQSPPLPRVASRFGTAPTNCPKVDRKLVHTRHNNQPDSVPPIIVWVGGGALVDHSAWELHNHRLLLPFGLSRTKYGYPQKIFWQRSSGAPTVPFAAG
jgi:hypothetical protein